MKVIQSPSFAKRIKKLKKSQKEQLDHQIRTITANPTIGEKKGDLKGSVLYVNLEPCAHYGRTPPCVDAIIEAGIKRVVIGMKDPNPMTAGKSIRKMRRAGIVVDILRQGQEYTELNEIFIKYVLVAEFN